MVLFQLCIVASYGSMGKYLQSLYSRSGFNARASDARNISRSPSSDEEQLSVSSRLKERVARIVGRSDPALAAIFRRCYDTLPRLITVEKRSGLQPYAFVSTGDIPAICCTYSSVHGNGDRVHACMQRVSCLLDTQIARL